MKITALLFLLPAIAVDAFAPMNVGSTSSKLYSSTVAEEEKIEIAGTSSVEVVVELF